VTGLIQSHTRVAREQDKSDIMINYTHELGQQEVIYFGHSYFISTHPDVGLKAAFDHIAEQNSWGSQETVSGDGSALTMTARVRECLGKWIKKYEIKTFVDAPCGDANWQAHIPGMDQVKYNGYDIADKPLKIAREKNSDHASMSFAQMDLTSEIPPKADIIMVRDVIQHLPLAKGRQMLLNAKRSGARYLAVSTFSDGGNIDIWAGSFYKDDVHATPFNLPSRLEACRNYDSDEVLPTDHLELIDLLTWNPFISDNI